jgi:hypothetical protein
MKELTIVLPLPFRHIHPNNFLKFKILISALGFLILKISRGNGHT